MFTKNNIRIGGGSIRASLKGGLKDGPVGRLLGGLLGEPKDRPVGGLASELLGGLLRGPTGGLLGMHAGGPTGRLGSLQTFLKTGLSRA